MDDEIGVKDHGRRRPVLATHAANIEPHREVEHIVELIRRNEPWSGRIEGFRRFALGPLSAAFELEGAFAHVVHNREPGDGGVGVFNRVEIAVRLPITTPSSTSQSALVDPRGMRTSSLGPMSVFGDLVNRIGSSGTGAPVSAA